jgi:hypothetical protein
MGMVCVTAGDIATVLWVMLLLSVTTLVQVAVKTVAQLLTPTVSMCVQNEDTAQVGVLFCVWVSITLYVCLFVIIIIISWVELGNLPFDHSKQCVS